MQLDDKWGFINQNFEEVIPAIYERVWSFEDSVRTKRGALYVHDYIAARNENAPVPIEIDEMTYFDNVRAPFIYDRACNSGYSHIK